MIDKLKALISEEMSPEVFFQKGMALKTISVPFIETITASGCLISAELIKKAFDKNLPDLGYDESKAIYFGIYEISAKYDLSGKVLYVSGMDHDSSDITAKNISWKPKWGKFKPAVLQILARIEDGIDPTKRLNPPIKTTAKLGQSEFPVYDLSAANPTVEFFELDKDQKQYLNYYVTLIVSIALIKAFLRIFPCDKPIHVGFDQGDIFRIK